jgi:glycosyltransferase involved in cell wall biosynthesis
MKVAVLIPCYNEALTIAKVIRDFKAQLPQAEIWVFDNASTDDTARIAREHQAHVRTIRRRGKGAVVRSMFREIDADIYVLVDGDDTYPAERVQDLIRPIAEGNADMAVGDRRSAGDYNRENTRRFHGIGNALVTYLVNTLFQCNLQDIMSGYRAFNRKFVKNTPILVDGFEIETEVTLHALDKLFDIVEVPVEYRDRPKGSESKLNTFRDGFRVLRSIVWIFKDCKPLIFFLVASLLFATVSVVSAVLLFRAQERLDLRVVSIASAACSALSLVCGLILDTLVKLQRESFEVQVMHFLKRESEKK